MVLSAFVTVGTTEFDDLVKEVTHPTFMKFIQSLGYTTLTVQYGRGNVQPVSGEFDGLKLVAYDFKPSLAADIHAADLVISHAGAGTVLEVLESGKPLVVAINETLMGNHQTELAAQLHRDGYLLFGSCSFDITSNLSEFSRVNACRQVAELVRQIGHAPRKLYRPADSSLFPTYLNSVMGISAKDE